MRRSEGGSSEASEDHLSHRAALSLSSEDHLSHRTAVSLPSEDHLSQRSGWTEATLEPDESVPLLDVLKLKETLK